MPAAAASPRGFQQYIHVFRAIAIILIVTAHTLPSLDWSANPRLGRVLDGLANEASIFFFFIAGYLFQHLSRSWSYGPYLLQKLKTVIAPYLLLSIPALFIFTQLTQRTGMWSWFYSIPEWQQVGLFLLTGKHLAPLWFVPTITLFYLAAPLFIWIDRRMPRLYWLVLPLWLLSLYLGRDGPMGPVNKAIYLLPVYALGMAFSHHREQAQALVGRYWPLLLLVTAAGFAGYVLQAPQPPQYLMLMKFPACLLMVHLLLKTHHWFGHRLDYIAHVSFGIFFVHAYFISFIKVVTVWLTTGRIYAGEGGSDLPASIPSVLVYALSVLLLSTLVIWTAQKLLGQRSRMLIGA
jgi:surface polysaccharide O-acyltransferase-like enzyme